MQECHGRIKIQRETAHARSPAQPVEDIGSEYLLGVNWSQHDDFYELVILCGVSTV